MTDLRYCAPPPTALRLATLGALTAIFDRRSTQTHVVTAPLPEILLAMGDENWDAAGLAARLGDDYDLGAEDPVAVIAERLAELEALGLVMRR